MEMLLLAILNQTESLQSVFSTKLCSSFTSIRKATSHMIVCMIGDHLLLVPFMVPQSRCRDLRTEGLQIYMYVLLACRMANEMKTGGSDVGLKKVIEAKFPHNRKLCWKVQSNGPRNRRNHQQASL